MKQPRGMHTINVVAALVLIPAVVVFWQDAANLVDRLLVWLFFPRAL
jgi:hypothetical protein